MNQLLPEDKARAALIEFLTRKPILQTLVEQQPRRRLTRRERLAYRWWAFRRRLGAWIAGAEFD